MRGFMAHLMAQHETLTQQEVMLARQQTALNALNLTVYSLRSDLDDLIAQTGIRPRFAH